MRQRLANRRECETTILDWKGIQLTINYGLDEQRSIREIFINAGKVGSEIEIMMSDAATAFSIALQSGVTPAALYKSMARDANGRPTSILGFILKDMVKANG